MRDSEKNSANPGFVGFLERAQAQTRSFLLAELLVPLAF
jgi:hypothetical protein